MFDEIGKHIAANPLKTATITLPGWEQSLHLKEMDAGAFQSYIDVYGDQGETASFSVDVAIKVIMLHLCNENGDRPTTDKQRIKLIHDLRQLKFAEITQLFSECMNVSGLSADAVEVAEGN